jgi:hypothetical protein
LHNSVTADNGRYQRDSSHLALKNRFENNKISNSQNHDVKIFFMDELIDSTLLPDPKSKALLKKKNRMKDLIRSLKTEES